jgi:hypothetical protein
MRHSVLKLISAMVFMAMLVMASPPAFAQGGATATLTGTVVDTSGGVVPGADVTVKSVTTGTVFTAVSGADGGFTIPAMPPGTYTATVTLQGFKTVELKDIVLNAAVTSNVKAVLELGEIKETVVVTGATEIVQTQSTAVASTMSARQISNLPLAGRGAFDLVNYMPGVASSTGTRNATVNGLPQATVNITLDGMNIQDNYLKTSDGMFTRVSPRIDAVEEVTMSTAASGADLGGQGAVQVRFVTRSGTNNYIGSVYYYFQRDWMNTNTWWNLNRNVDAVTGKPQGKQPVVQYQPGGRFGGPILKDKLFFFFNYEWVKTPATISASRTILTPDAQRGIFTYGAGTVNLFDLAAKNNQLTTVDPLIASILNDINAAAKCDKCVVNAISGDAVRQALNYQFPQTGQTKFPTLRLDYNVTSKQRVSASITQNHLISDPDTLNGYEPAFPGFSVHSLQDSYRWVAQLSLRSVLSKNLVNEVRMGGTGGSTFFAPTLQPEMFTGTPNLNGYAIAFPTMAPSKGLSSPYAISANSAREGATRMVEDTLSWLKGKHSLSMGGGFTRGDIWYWQQQQVPTISLGVVTGDSADDMFKVANFPGASADELTYAKNLYAVLTGRVATIGRNARVGADGQTYTILGDSNQYGRMWQVGAFLQDAWRLKPSLTLNGGLRYEIQLPFYSLNNSYAEATIDDIFGLTGPGSDLVVGSVGSNLGNAFKPGVLEGSTPFFSTLTKGTGGFQTDWNNVAPSIGAAWTTGAEKGVWHKILGSHGDSVVRGGYSIAYQRGGMSDFTGVYGSNPGIVIDATRSLTNGNLGTLPVLLRSSDLSAPNTALTRTEPIPVPSASTSMYAFDPNIKLPWAETGTIGLQRALAKNMAVEVRYVYASGHSQWTTGNLGNRNYNELDIVENGFLNEFQLAQANYAANTAANNGKGFAYTGIAGTSPLPIFMANINGLGGAANYNDPSKYTTTGWTNSTLLGYMNAYNSNPQSAASNLRNNATYKTNMAKVPSLTPVNFWVVNPDVSNAYVVTNGPNTRYNGLQLIFNRRMAQGLMVQANYSFGKANQWDFYSLRKPFVEKVSNYTNSGGNASGNVNHLLAVNWVYELPFGQGRKYGSSAGSIMNRIIGDWNFMGLARFVSGRMVDFGNVRMVGFSEKDLKKMYQLRKTTDPTNQYRTLVWTLPQEVIDNTILAFSTTAAGYSKGAPTGRYFAPANSPSCVEEVSGYGDCGVRSLVVTGPPVIRFDFTFSKRIAIKGRVNAEFQWQIFNVFNRVNFDPNVYTGSTLDSYQITSARDSSRTMQLAFRVNF